MEKLSSSLYFLWPCFSYTVFPEQYPNILVSSFLHPCAAAQCTYWNKNSDFCKYKWKTRCTHQKSIKWKTHIIKKHFTWIKKNQIYDKNISYWIQIYFDWIKMYFDIIIKSDIMKIYFIEYKFILIK